MKRSVKILAVAMVALMLCLSLASCGKKLSGTYEMDMFGTGIEMEFKGSKVTFRTKVGGSTVGDPVEGKYSIKDDKITFTFETDKEGAEDLSGEFDFEEGDDYIVIGELGKLTKKD